jgi:galactokinase
VRHEERVKAARAFEERFQRPPQVGARAPGRVNLIGEHTDYNQGLVLPCAIDRDTVVWAAPGEGRRVRVHSLTNGETAEFETGALARRGAWVDYVQGAVFALGPESLPGADLLVASDVPTGSGLSSSAALGVALVHALAALRGEPLAPRDAAVLAWRGESEFVGVPCGVMDPMASALGRAGCALRIDCRSLQVTPVPLAESRAALLVADSGVRRELASGSYGNRRAECEAALAEAQAAGIGAAEARSLRDFGLDDLPALERALGPVALRRVRHVIRENARVEAFCTALAQGDLAAAGALLREGHRSLRDDFEVSTPELDALCAIGDALPGVYGSRLTGAGFGGCSVHLVDPERADAAAVALAAGFAERFGRRPPLLRAAPSEGASLLTAPD